MIAQLFLTLAWQAEPVQLKEADLLSIYASALHYEASRVTGRVDQYTITANAYGTAEQPRIAFNKLRPLLANFPSPVVEERAAKSKHRVNLYATITDLIDPRHAVVEMSHYRYNAETDAPSTWAVVVRGTSGWKVTQPTLPPSQERALQQTAFIFLLSNREYGYTGETAYAGLIDKRWKSSVNLGWHPARDPHPTVMQALWRRGWSLKYISETPEGRGYSKPRYEFGVGDIQPIDRKRALVHLVRNHWYMEPGYNEDFGPEGASEATFLARREGQSWQIAGIRGYWYSVPAE